MLFSFSACTVQKENKTDASAQINSAVSSDDSMAELSFTKATYPLSRNGVELHLDCTVAEGAKPEKIYFLLIA